MRFFWISVLGLIFVCAWQINHRKELVSQRQRPEELASVTTRYQTARANWLDQMKAVARLEQVTLDQDETQLISWLTELSREMTVEIVSTAKLSPKRENIYLLHPFQVEIKGDYDALGRFLNRLEQERPQICIYSAKMFTYKYQPGVPILQLTFLFYTIEGGRNGERPELTAGLPKEEAVSAPMVSIEWGKPYTYPYPSASKGRNPFVEKPEKLSYPSLAEPTETDLEWPTLSAILWDSTAPVAILELNQNTVMAHAGEFVGETKILEIKPLFVRLLQKGKVKQLDLWPPIRLGFR